MPIRKTPEPSSAQMEPVKNTTAEKRAPEKIQWTVSKPRYKMTDLLLNRETAAQLEDVISFFENQTLLFKTWGMEERYGGQSGLAVNLYGPPGTGKTVAAHAIADALQKSMICVDYAEIESKYVGETSKNLSNLFKTATETGAVIFFDEADALLSKRVTNMTSATDVSVNQTRSVLLNLLNQYTGIILFATNFIQNFDAAFLRRIRYHVQFYLPDAELRRQLWRMYIPSKMPCLINFDEMAEKYENISGSDIATAVFSAAVCAARNRETSIPQKYFEDAIQRCLDVKRANAGNDVTVKRKILSDEEAKELKLQ